MVGNDTARVNCLMGKPLYVASILKASLRLVMFCGQCESMPRNRHFSKMVLIIWLTLRKFSKEKGNLQLATDSRFCSIQERRKMQSVDSRAIGDFCQLIILKVQRYECHCL